MKQISNRSKNGLLLIMVVCFLAITLFGLYEMQTYRDRAVDFKMNNELEKYCDNISAIFSSTLESNIANGMEENAAIETAVDDVYNSYRGGNEIFNVLATDESVLYYMNEEKQDMYGLSLNGLVEKFISDGGDNVEALVENIKMGKSGACVMSFDKDNVYYMVYCKSFETVAGKFTMLSCVKSSYYTLTANIDRHYTTMFVVLMIVFLILVVIVVATAYFIRKYNNLYADKNEELNKSQANISELNDKIIEKEKNEKHGVVKDDSLGVYSSYFMSSFINDAHNKKVDVSVAIIGASYRNRFNRTVWNEFLTYVKTGVPENYIFGVLNSGHLAMLGVNCEDAEFKSTIDKVLKGANQKFVADELETVCVYEKKKSADDTIDRAIKDAITAFENA